MSTAARYRGGYISKGISIRGCLVESLKWGHMIKGLLAAFIIFIVATFPATWLLMLFLGNMGVAIGYWGVLPMGILVSVLLGSASAPTVVRA